MNVKKKKKNQRFENNFNSKTLLLTQKYDFYQNYKLNGLIFTIIQRIIIYNNFLVALNLIYLK